MAKAQRSILLKPDFSFSSGLLNHRNLDSSFFHCLAFSAYKTISNIITFLLLAGPTSTISVLDRIEKFQEAN